MADIVALKKLEKHASDCINETNALLELLNEANTNVEGLGDETTESEKTTSTTTSYQTQKGSSTEVNLLKAYSLDSLNGPAVINLMNNDIDSLLSQKLYSAAATQIPTYQDDLTMLNSNSFDLLPMLSNNYVTEGNMGAAFTTHVEEFVHDTTSEDQPTKSTTTESTTIFTAPPTSSAITLKHNPINESEIKDKLKKLQADLKLVGEVQNILNGIKTGNHKVRIRDAGEAIDSGLCSDTSPLFELSLKIVTKSPYETEKIRGLGKIFKLKEEANKCRKKRLADSAKKISALGKIYKWKMNQKNALRKKRNKKQPNSRKKRFLVLRPQNFQ